MEQQQKVEKAKEPIAVFERLFTNNVTARILDYFISHKYHSYSINDISKTLQLSNKEVSTAIEQLENRDFVRRDKSIENADIPANYIGYTLYIESMTANTIIRAGIEIANAERISSKEI